jgi:hypothetical protein
VHVPRVSVVIPTHRRPTMLRDALASAQTQTEPDIEILVVVDGDDSDTADWVRTVADPRVRLIWDGVRRGEAGNTMRGFELSTAPVVGVLHDDDLWEPTLLTSLLCPLEADPELSVVFGDHWIIDEAGRIDETATSENSRHYKRTGLRPGRHEDFRHEVVVDRTIPAVMTSLYRKEHLDFRDMPELPANFDYWLAWVAVRGPKPVYFVDERLSRYRVHGGQGTARARRAWVEASVVIFAALLAEPQTVADHEELRRRLAAGHRRLGLLHRQADEPHAIADGLRAVRIDPGLKAAVGLMLILLPPGLSRRITDRHPVSV